MADRRGPSRFTQSRLTMSGGHSPKKTRATMVDDPCDFAGMLARELKLLQARLVQFYALSQLATKEEAGVCQPESVDGDLSDLTKKSVVRGKYVRQFAEDPESLLAIADDIEDIEIVISEREPIPEYLNVNATQRDTFYTLTRSDTTPSLYPEYPEEDEELSHAETFWGLLTYKLVSNAGRDSEDASFICPSSHASEDKIGHWDLHTEWSLRAQPMSPTMENKMKTSLRARRAHVSHEVDVIVDWIGSMDSKHGDFLESTNCLRCLTVDPESFRWSLWTSMGVLVLITDFLTVPLEVAGLVEQMPRVAQYLFFAYWVTDMPVAFLTGYHADGLVEMRPSMTIMNYARTWFLPDCMILLLDILYLSSVAQGGSLLRVFRIFRILRFCRARKIYVLYKAMFNYVLSVYLILTLKLLSLILFMLMLTHWVACMWYGISSRIGTDDTWSYAIGPDTDRPFYYVLALHWALCQFAPATTNISAENVYERAFAALIAVLSLIVFSSFISNVTNAVNQLKAATMSKMSEHSRMRDFFLRMQVSSDLGHRIQRFFNHNYHSFACPVREIDIKAFHDLPETLRVRLHDEIYMPLLQRHEVFDYYGHYSRPTLSRICHHAFSESYYYADQDLFIEATECNQMRLVLKGTAEYNGPSGSALFESRSFPPRCADATGWISDAALWITWEHSGQLQALTSCQVIELDCELVRGIMSRTGGFLFKACKIYAILFLSYVEEIAEGGGMVTDAPLKRDVLVNIVTRAERFLNAGLWAKGPETFEGASSFVSVFQRVLGPSSVVAHPMKSFWKSAGGKNSRLGLTRGMSGSIHSNISAHSALSSKSHDPELSMSSHAP